MQPGCICYINGQFIEADHAKISATDLAVMRGYGVFDSMRTYKGIPFRMDDHLYRLKRSADLVGMTLPWTMEDLKRLILKTLDKNRFPESSIRIIITGGDTEDLFTPTGKPGLIVLVMPLLTFPQSYYVDGIKVATARLERFLPEAKTTQYTPGQIAMKKARAHDPEIVEALYVDRQGNVTEGIASNLFLFIDGILITPGEGMLFGITRQVVLELAQSLFQVEEKDVSPDDLMNADEVFITGSSKEIMPVRQVDDKIVGNGRVGLCTKQLMDAFRRMVEGLTN